MSIARDRRRFSSSCHRVTGDEHTFPATQNPHPAMSRRPLPKSPPFPVGCCTVQPPHRPAFFLSSSALPRGDNGNPHVPFVAGLWLGLTVKRCARWNASRHRTTAREGPSNDKEPRAAVRAPWALVSRHTWERSAAGNGARPKGHGFSAGPLSPVGDGKPS